MGTLILGLGVALVAGAAVLAVSCLRLRSTVGFLLAAYLVASAEIAVVSLVLSIVDALTRAALLLVLSGVFAVALAVWARDRPRAPLGGTAAALSEALRDRAVATLAALAVLTHVYVLGIALTVPQSLPDTMLYHLPRAALWKQQHAIGYVPNASDERIDVFPPIAEIQTTASMILSEGDRYVTIVQLLALLGACIAIVGIARRLGLSRSASLFGALAFATFTVVVLQAPTALNDLVVASLLTICAYFAMGRSRAELTLSALALALAVGTKGTAVFALPALALFALATQPRGRRWTLVAFGAAGLVIGSFWFAVNLVETGQLDGGVVLDRGVSPLAERIRLSVLDLLELSDFEAKGWLASPIWGVVALVVAVAAAAVFALRRNRRGAAVALLVGAVAFLAAPMLVTWARVVDRAVEHARVSVGLGGSASASRLPDEFGESPMHSSFGLAFVVLLFGAGALAVADVARRRLPVAALLALCAVPLTVLVTAVALAYDPQRMRYVAFSVALAAAVFGIALRVRPLAWTVVVLTAGTLTVAVAYFVPRPGGLALLPGNRDSERSARWFVQGGSGNGDPEAFRFLSESVPADATIAVAAERNTYLYPLWDPGLRRSVVFVPASDRVSEDVEWLVVGPSKVMGDTKLDRAGWRLELASKGGWRVFRR